MPTGYNTQTRFNIKKFSILITLHLRVCDLYCAQRERYLSPYNPLADQFYNRSVVCLQRGTS